MENTTTPGWKAILAVTVAGGALLWHILACIESPMAFSPSGKELAFVVMTPYEEKDLHLVGTHVYRLMVLSEGGRVRIVEQADRHMLTAPAYSPDGRYLAYLRIPLMTAQAANDLAEKVKQRAKELENIPPYPLPQAATAPAPKPEGAQTEDLALPPLEKTASFYKSALIGPMAPVELVVRDAMATDVVIATTTVDLPVFDYGSGDASRSPLFTYLLARPQYSPDGQWVYFCVGDVAVAVDPKTGNKRLLAAPATVATLSPDGKTLAAAYEKTVSFIRTDGQKATALRWERDLSASGIVWADNQTLALATLQDKQVRIELLRTDGTIARSIDVPTPETRKENSTGELAMAGDGKRMVLCYEGETQFLDGAGKLLAQRKDDEKPMAQPTFTPDGKRVAFKLLGKDAAGQGFVEAIVFFSPEGKELSRVKLPPPPATQPTSEPTTRAAP